MREAEATLKKSKMKDHYKVLGIEASATEVEIKKAYRQMSLVPHPHKGGYAAVFKQGFFSFFFFFFFFFALFSISV